MPHYTITKYTAMTVVIPLMKRIVSSTTIQLRPTGVHAVKQIVMIIKCKQETMDIFIVAKVARTIILPPIHTATDTVLFAAIRSNYLHFSLTVLLFLTKQNCLKSIA